jgi:hypothetical protein
MLTMMYHLRRLRSKDFIVKTRTALKVAQLPGLRGKVKPRCFAVLLINGIALLINRATK